MFPKKVLDQMQYDAEVGRRNMPDRNPMQRATDWARSKLGGNTPVNPSQRTPQQQAEFDAREGRRLMRETQKQKNVKDLQKPLEFVRGLPSKGIGIASTLATTLTADSDQTNKWRRLGYESAEAYQKAMQEYEQRTGRSSETGKPLDTKLPEENSDGSGNRDTPPPTPSNIPQFGTQMGSRATMDSMQEFLKGRGLSEHLRNPFSSNQLPGTPEQSKALAGGQTPQAGDQEAMKGEQELQGGGMVKPTETKKPPQLELSEISQMFRNSTNNIEAARQAQAMRGTFTNNGRYFMSAPQTKDGLVEITRQQYGGINDSTATPQDVLDEQIKFGGLVQEQKDKYAGKSVAEVNAAYAAMSPEDKKKYGMAMHAAHFGKFNTPEIKPPAAEQNPEFKTGFDQKVVEGAELPSGLVSYNSDRPMVMQEQNETIGFDLKGIPQDKEKPLSQDFFEKYKNSFERKLFG